MSWKIRIEKIDDKTGESFVQQAILTDEIVTNSTLDLLAATFTKLTLDIKLKIAENNK